MRHPGDLVRVGAAVAVIVVTASLVHHDRVAVLEVDAFRLVNDLPAWMFAVLWPVMQVGNVAAVPFVAGAIAIGRRWWLALQVLVAGGGVWLLAKVVKDFIVRPRPGALLPDVHLHDAPVGGLGYPSGHAAVAAAMATLVIPHLPRPWRRVATVVIVAVGVARVFVGAHLPLDVIGGAALGWGVASAVHYAFGAPAGQSVDRLVGDALARAGHPHDRMVVVQRGLRRSDRYEVVTRDGRRLFVKVVTAERRDRDVLFRAWQGVRNRGDRTLASPARSPLAELEHEALMGTVAAAGGVRTPRVVMVVAIARGGAMLVHDWVDGRPLRQADPPEVLADARRQVERLAACGVVHNQIDASHLLVAASGDVTLVGFGAAVFGAAGDAADVDGRALDEVLDARLSDRG